MKNALSLETLTLKDLGVIASAAQVPRWSRLKKTELLARLVALGDSAPSLAQALRIRDAKRSGVPCDALFPERRDAQSVPSAPLKSAPSKRTASTSAPKKTEESLENRLSDPQPTKKKPSETPSTGRKSARAVDANPFVPQRETPRSKKTTKPAESKEKSQTKEAAEPRRLTSTSEAPQNVSASVKRSTSKTDSTKTTKPAVKPTAKKPTSPPAPTSAPLPSLFSDETPSNPPESPSRVSTLKEKMRLRKTLGRETDRTDRLVLMVCDPYWLRACWEITPRLVDRVRSAMGRHWHTADPTLRLFKIIQEPQGATRREFVADVLIRGGVDNWYVDVDDPPCSFVVELGYLARDKQFFTLISSNVVETPQQSVRESLGRLGVPSEFNALSQRGFAGSAPGFPPYRSTSFARDDSSATETKFSSALDRTYDSNVPSIFPREFQIEVDAELVVKGKASRGVQVRVKEESVRVKPDGTFLIRYRLPERRHVFPVVATSADGVETQTIILAVDRNTKILDPVFKEEEEE